MLCLHSPKPLGQRGKDSWRSWKYSNRADFVEEFTTKPTGSSSPVQNHFWMDLVLEHPQSFPFTNQIIFITLQGTSHLRKRKIIFKSALVWGYVSSQEGTTSRMHLKLQTIKIYFITATVSCLCALFWVGMLATQPRALGDPKSFHASQGHPFRKTTRKGEIVNHDSLTNLNFGTSLITNKKYHNRLPPSPPNPSASSISKSA